MQFLIPISNLPQDEKLRKVTEKNMDKCILSSSCISHKLSLFMITYSCLDIYQGKFVSIFNWCTNTFYMNRMVVIGYIIISSKWKNCLKISPPQIIWSWGKKLSIETNWKPSKVEKWQSYVRWWLEVIFRQKKRLRRKFFPWCLRDKGFEHLLERSCTQQHLWMMVWPFSTCWVWCEENVLR